jgi:hypothetical protein
MLQQPLGGGPCDHHLISVTGECQALLNLGGRCLPQSGYVAPNRHGIGPQALECRPKRSRPLGMLGGNKGSAWRRWPGLARSFGAGWQTGVNDVEHGSEMGSVERLATVGAVLSGTI